jgi:hypothetical protein
MRFNPAIGAHLLAASRRCDPCLQSDVSARCDRADLARRLSVSSREIPQRTPVNGTLMAR